MAPLWFMSLSSWPQLWTGHTSYTVLKIMWKHFLLCAIPMLSNHRYSQIPSDPLPKFYAPPPASPILVNFLVSKATTWFLHSCWTLVIHLPLLLHLCGQVSLVCSLQPNLPFIFPKPSPAWNLLRHYRTFLPEKTKQLKRVLLHVKT